MKIDKLIVTLGSKQEVKFMRNFDEFTSLLNNSEWTFFKRCTWSDKYQYVGDIVMSLKSQYNYRDCIELRSNGEKWIKDRLHKLVAIKKESLKFD